MCGIVGYIGHRDAVDVAMTGLRRLEYRGYDSAGIAVLNDGHVKAVKAAGKLTALDRKLDREPLSAHLGIGHTRWATHGAPTERNAHPHLDASGRIAVVHNGIIENYRDLRAELEQSGVTFKSDTDSETLPHLIAREAGDLFTAVQGALRKVRGTYAVGVICADEPGVLVAARLGSPLIVGFGDGERFIASDVPAIMQYTRTVAYIEDARVCRIERDNVYVETVDGRPVDLETEAVDWDDAAAEKGGYDHFMRKEIHEQPVVMRNALRGRIGADGASVDFEAGGFEAHDVRGASKIVIVACGTAWHAGLVGQRLIERYARIPVEIDHASEYRYRSPIVPPGTIVLPVSQSGETADTIEAVRIAQEKGAKVVSILNVVGSSIARMSDAVIYTYAGPEIGVASTKAYTAQLTAFALLATYLGLEQGTLDREHAAVMLSDLEAIPDKMQACLDREAAVQECAGKTKYRDPRSAFFMGRGFNYPTALEGALKLKEISYIHAEGYAAGEMKHGPIALITDEVPMIGIATRSDTYEKMISNIQEIRARQGIVLTVATDGDHEAPKHSDDVLYVPECPDPLSPIVNAVPLQLLAYHIAVNRGCNVDQPRNLAKSVTVE